MTSIRLALPNKGRIAQPVRELVEKSGIHLVGTGERMLVAKTVDPEIEVLFARPVDIPEYVANGAADIGITGHDMVMERGSDVEELLDLKMGSATLVAAVPEDSTVVEVTDLDGARVATEFPTITKTFFERHGVSVTIVPVGGACEATPYLGIADAIVDLTSSGTTLKTNRLRVITEVLRSSTGVIANRDALVEKKEKVHEVLLALESVVRAQGQCYLMMNAQREALPAIEEVLPGLGGPTVMDVASKEGLVAVHAVVAEECVYQLINQLKQAGARDILVMSIERMIP
ncbi:ATP phosphoribosyltransferase [Methanofollis aquaemaris]|uniref:ATP phosphoribosyltransferase n=1 Tax=Methanofollis aquaemaris TaxID=126734 RepID=A0A8A3S8V3_9EURY|nr:ATP phosphoribosyltransferase [Methanofollis aquaemaris]QSZ68101.1 ATP phosphoribosyltransferase [Methanofollis aquaemaris]